ncbi:MbtH family NRPS accessory protein [bacterium M00.F.Ca.ET.228.01.1.1]|uniref:MbtH family protein n=1 Tax=Burkholderiaceae TaxID=119060 RepID=UPI001091D2BC|nr:MbtH family NRPS accessory protein [Paraburkholderia phenoliruptrix]TGP43099.1 MbtH family NRPS accessory protein [bacterium M00.F.Ca.ET.228.01.1.1]TGS00538.1 MbtH family NRPS accessory protein [bacterium M00.F.Ca.ET.191.01.1.1]TGU04924.1 MbtH family NRPS accessory protein [bacterium M00.F.Ca.ET.155.01.1.1]MBW0446970.1 MbtH family NRPS accessory protein [Paraburkholderia phenoliruptrix]MBW9099466.1 MbtH family NRPS accessory protein [Paraburkholderia phenoliruptrix]
MTQADDQQFDVVVNHEAQYSIWPAWKAKPNGWQAAGFTGNREQCLEFVRKEWTDLRPLSVRRQMDLEAQQ